MATMSNDATNDNLVPTIALPKGYTTATFLSAAMDKIRRLAQKYRKENGNPPEAPDLRGWLDFLHVFFPWLEMDAPMTPAIRDKSKIDKALQLLFDPEFMCPEEIASTARRIYDKFEEEEWGKHNEPESDPEDSSPVPAASTGTIRVDDMYTLERPPPPNHPIWGRRGIMYGFLKKRSRKLTYVIDPRRLAEKRPFKIFGHNGLEPGAWWPFQKVAHFHGAHGHPQAGISGNADEGAWSVVISGNPRYEDLDCDLGDTIWYSSDNSHDNTDPTRVLHTSNMTRSLHRSIYSRKPVRVLRSSKANSAFAPRSGIRYDGLYRVVDVVRRKNGNGGLYERFKLVRLTGQRPLEEIWRTSPTRQQLADYERIKNGY
jgi:hypothetical protein